MKGLNGVLLFVVIVFILGLIGFANREVPKGFLYEKDKPFADRTTNPDPPLTSTGEKFVYDRMDFVVNILKPGSELTLRRNLYIQDGSIIELCDRDDKAANANKASHLYFTRCYVSLEERNVGVIKAGSRIKVNKVLNESRNPGKGRVRKGAFTFMGTTENGTMIKIEIVSGLWIRVGANASEGEYDPTMRDLDVFFAAPVIKGPKEI